MENYREFNNTELEQLVGKAVRHKKSKNIYLIIVLQKDLIVLGDATTLYSKSLLKYFEFLDGTPCGVKEEKTFNIMELDVNKKYQIKGYINSIICYQPQSNRWVYNESEAGVKLNPEILNAQFIEL